MAQTPYEILQLKDKQRKFYIKTHSLKSKPIMPYFKNNTLTFSTEHPVKGLTATSTNSSQRKYKQNMTQLLKKTIDRKNKLTGLLQQQNGENKDHKEQKDQKFREKVNVNTLIVTKEYESIKIEPEKRLKEYSRQTFSRGTPKGIESWSKTHRKWKEDGKRLPMKDDELELQIKGNLKKLNKLLNRETVYSRNEQKSRQISQSQRSPNMRIGSALNYIEREKAQHLQQYQQSFGTSQNINPQKPTNPRSFLLNRNNPPFQPKYMNLINQGSTMQQIQLQSYPQTMPQYSWRQDMQNFMEGHTINKNFEKYKHENQNRNSYDGTVRKGGIALVFQRASPEGKLMINNAGPNSAVTGYQARQQHYSRQQSKNKYVGTDKKRSEKGENYSNGNREGRRREDLLGRWEIDHREDVEDHF